MKKEAKEAILNENAQRELRIKELRAYLKRLDEAGASWQIRNSVSMEISSLINDHRNARDQVRIFPRTVMGLARTVDRLKIFKRRGKRMTGTPPR